MTPEGQRWPPRASGDGGGFPVISVCAGWCADLRRSSKTRKAAIGLSGLSTKRAARTRMVARSQILELPDLGSSGGSSQKMLLAVLYGLLYKGMRARGDKGGWSACCCLCSALPPSTINHALHPLRRPSHQKPRWGAAPAGSWPEDATTVRTPDSRVIAQHVAWPRS